MAKKKFVKPDGYDGLPSPTLLNTATNTHSEPILEETPSVHEIVPEGVRVRAAVYYSNGDTAVHWYASEVRRISRQLLNRLEKDLPGNWTVLDG